MKYIFTHKGKYSWKTIFRRTNIRKSVYENAAHTDLTKCPISQFLHQFAPVNSSSQYSSILVAVIDNSALFTF
jgi:hypothetical protein